MGGDHENTACSYYELGITKFMPKDHTSATESDKRALNIRQKVLGEDHEKTADSYFNLGVPNIWFENTPHPLSHTSEH